jgi:hypothetical protein
MDEQVQSKLLSSSLTYGVNIRSNNPPNTGVHEREQEDFRQKYNEIITKLGNRYNILLNQKIKGIKLFYIEEFKKLESVNSNTRKEGSTLKLYEALKLRIRHLDEWLKDMQFIWSFFRRNNTGFVLEDNSIYIKLINEITTNKESLKDTLNDIDREIERILEKKYNFTEESLGTQGGRRSTQRKRTPRTRKVVQTRKKRY